MRTEHHEGSHTFWKPITWEAVHASGVDLITHPGVDFTRLPLRVTCSLRRAEKHDGSACVRIDYFIEALWSLSGGEPEWNDITRRSLSPEDDAAACGLFAEMEEEAIAIDRFIERLLGAKPRAAPPTSARSPKGGVL
jgi:hypothetical protein